MEEQAKEAEKEEGMSEAASKPETVEEEKTSEENENRANDSGTQDFKIMSNENTQDQKDQNNDSESQDQIKKLPLPEPEAKIAITQETDSEVDTSNLCKKQEAEEEDSVHEAPDSKSTTDIKSTSDQTTSDDATEELEDNKPLKRGKKRCVPLSNGGDAECTKTKEPKRRTRATKMTDEEVDKVNVQNQDLPIEAEKCKTAPEEEDDSKSGEAKDKQSEESSQAVASKTEGDDLQRDANASIEGNASLNGSLLGGINEKTCVGKRDPYNFSEDEFGSSSLPNKAFPNGPLKRENSGSEKTKKTAKTAKLRNLSCELEDFEEALEDEEVTEDEEDEDDDDDDEQSENKPDFSQSSLDDLSCGQLGDDDDRLVIAEEEHDQKKNLDDSFDHADSTSKPRRKHNRFNGMSEEDVAKRLLPDLIAQELDILIIGINPGMYAAFKGHHYAGPGNHFWKCMFLSGLIPHPMSADDDYKLLEFGIGFTNIVERTTKGSANLSRKEIVGGTRSLLEKIKSFRPKIAVFNGKGIYEVFSGKKDFHFGKQPDVIEGTDTHVWVMPNSSARCAQLPRAVDKVPFYEALKKFRDYLTGSIKKLDDSEVVFTNVKLKNFNELSPQKKLAAAAAAAAAAASISGDSSDSMNSEFKVLSCDSGGFSDGGLEIRVDPITGKKRRGRPPKPRPDGTMPPPKRRAVDAEGNPMPRGSNPIDPLTGKKKRGRPKKCDLPLGSTPVPSTTKKPKKIKAERLTRDLDPSSMNSAQLSNQDGLGIMHTTSINNKPTKVVPPLPPFSPHFGRVGDIGKMEDDEKPVDLKSHKNSYDDSMHHRGSYDGGPHSHVGNNRLHEPCDYSGQQPEDYSSNSANASGYHYPPHPPPPMKSDPQSNYSSSNSTPPHYPNYPGNHGQGNNSKSSDDVTTKSITGLESLVDQIPALAENDSGVFSGSGAGSHPNTPRSVGPYSPAPSSAVSAQFQSSFHAPLPSHSAGGNNAFGTPPYVASSSDSSDYPIVSSSVSNCTPTDFSVNSLVHSSTVSAYRSISPVDVLPDPFSVSSLTSAEMAAAASKYPGLAGSNPYAAAGMFHSSAGSSFGAGGFLSGPNSFPAGHPMSAASAMGAMGHMGAMAGMSYYGQYPNGPYGGTAPGFAPSPYSHGLHMPNPSYPYPSPYGQSPYSQSPYF